MVGEEFPEVHFIRNRDNRGFSKADSRAIKESAGVYILRLNSDILLENNAVAIMHDFMQAHPRAPGCGPLLLNDDKLNQQSIESHFTVIA